MKYSCGLFVSRDACRGLDSTSCAQCIELLRFLARGGRTIIITIHQPSARIFERFDSLYAVAEGRCIYKGSPQALLPFLASKGLECPPYHNPADFCKYKVTCNSNLYVICWKLYLQDLFKINYYQLIICCSTDSNFFWLIMLLF